MSASKINQGQSEAINALRFLAVDAVERAGSGHPGAPLALAPLAYRLFTLYMRHDPKVPDWFDRDRFVLSNGHASMLLYAALHLSGYSLSIDDIKQFRQWNSRTPGHPERGVTPGVEISTGPLGQGFVNAIGMAIAERHLGARFNSDETEIINHRTWAICGDGDMMEGVSSESASLAGRLGTGLRKLTIFYDDNHVTLDGPASVEMNEDVARRFDAYHWHVARVADVNDLDALDSAVDEAIRQDRPSLIIVRSHIGYGSPVQDTSKAHGAPLGTTGVAATRLRLGWNHPPFSIPDAIYANWRAADASRASAHDDWLRSFERYESQHPERAAELKRIIASRLPDRWRDALPRFNPAADMATRTSGAQSLGAFARVIPELVGGAADLVSSTYTRIEPTGSMNDGDWSGRNLHFGVREHAMGAICNGIAAHGGLRVFCSTFLVFSDYMREPIRLAAMMQLPVIFVFTHDSIGIGEDGPTHQPIEQLASLRAMPGLAIIRPADANESAQAWAEAISRNGPTVLVLSRQALPILDPAKLNVAAGASIVEDGEDAVIVASGSEVSLAIEARHLLQQQHNIHARVVSLSSWELFRAQGAVAREAVLPGHLPTIAVEAASPLGWLEFADEVIGLTRFGASAPAAVIFDKLGFTAEAIANKVFGQVAKRKHRDPA